MVVVSDLERFPCIVFSLFSRPFMPIASTLIILWHGGAVIKTKSSSVIAWGEGRGLKPKLCLLLKNEVTSLAFNVCPFFSFALPKQPPRNRTHYSSYHTAVLPPVHTFERLLWNPWANVLQTSCGAFCQRGLKIYTNGHGPLIKMAAVPVWRKNTKNSSFPEPWKLWG